MEPKIDHSGFLTNATARGPRAHQEDRAFSSWIETGAGSGWLLAIFDGHRGVLTADTASQAVAELFKNSFQRIQGDVAKTLSDVFLALNQMTQNHLSGSTASLVFIPAGAMTVYLAVLGDSPIAILDSRGHAHIGPEHNIRTNTKERLAAEARGGRYADGYLEDSQVPGIGLQMTRSLGDADLSQVLLREPEIQNVPLGGNGIVLVGSDGLLLPGMSPNEDQLRRLLNFIREGHDARAVVNDALKRATGDNVTAIVWRKD